MATVSFADTMRIQHVVLASEVTQRHPGVVLLGGMIALPRLESNEVSQPNKYMTMAYVLPKLSRAIRSL